MNKLLLLVIPLLLFTPTYATLSLSVTEPNNITYPYSINIPINITTTDAVTCQYSIDNGTNTTFLCSDTDKFERDFDGHYTITIYAINTSSTEHTVESSISFAVNRDFSKGKGIIAAGLIWAVMCIALFCGHISVNLGKKFAPLSYFMFGLSALFVIFTIRTASAATREYLKVPAFENVLTNIYLVVFWSLFVFLCYFILYYFLLVKVGGGMQKDAMYLTRLKKGFERGK